MESVFMKGFLVGLLLCAPFGPVGVLVFRRTVMEGRLAGSMSLLGGSLADALYCSLAGLGIHAVPVFLSHERAAFQLLGGLILIVVGVHISLSHPIHRPLKTQRRGLFGAFTGIFFLVLANPMPMLLFAAIFTALGIRGWGDDSMTTSCLVAGVFTGSAAWAPLLAGVPLLRLEFIKKQFHYLNRLSGSILAVFGVAIAGMGIMS